MHDYLLMGFTWFVAVYFDRAYTKWKARKKDKATFPLRYTCQVEGCYFLYKSNHLEGFMSVINEHEGKHADG